ncbi:hypothetical protein CTEN210_10853 [Chaetoceros tenuissimus]|uniref:Pentacotripeptide-repeat region of PRORP domain-containing protein n=1 Tax=Chaetoceros tenuissimus TaxID=426638 RepID=A0AAD3H8C2_9STRA|nr:hypothetical protein CTEN210_10853 [Chaetoceros tenuissimus]
MLRKCSRRIRIPAGLPLAGKRQNCIKLSHKHRNRIQNVRKNETHFMSLVRITTRTLSSSTRSIQERTSDLLDYIENQSNASYTLMDFDSVMEEWVEHKSIEGAQNAEALLDALEKSNLAPNAISYNHALNSYVQSDSGIKGAEKCEEILDRMISRCREYDEKDDFAKAPPEPLVSTFNHVMNAWAKSGSIESGYHAERVFRKMERWNFDCSYNLVHEHFTGIKPSARSLSIVLEAWGNSGHAKSFDRILAIFDNAYSKFEINKESSSSLLHVHQNVTPKIPMNTITFNTVLNGLYQNGKGKDIIEVVERVFSQMENMESYILGKAEFQDSDEEHSSVKPNTRTYSILMKCLTNATVEAKDKSIAETNASKVENILVSMEERYENGEDIKPNQITYTACMQAWAECSTVYGAQRTLSLLERMENLFEETSDKDFIPNTIHYNTCLSALCKVNDSEMVMEAEKLLGKMLDKEVADSISFNTIMNGILNSDPLTAFTNIQLLYERMEKSNIDPDTVTFNIMMDAIRNSKQSNAVTLILELLEKMISISKISPEFTPDAASFTIALNTISSSNSEEKAEPARKVFQQMISLHASRNDDKMKPDVRIFSAFIQACANQGGPSERKRAALKLALGAYENLCKSPKYGTPNSYTYGSLIKAIGRLGNQQEKFRLLEHVIRKCISEGQLSNITLNTFRKSASKQLQDKVFGQDRIPFEYFRYVRKQDRPNGS